MTWVHGMKKALSGGSARDASVASAAAACARLRGDADALWWLCGAAAARWGAVAEVAEYTASLGRALYGGGGDGRIVADTPADAMLRTASAEACALRRRERALRDALLPAQADVRALRARVAGLDALRAGWARALGDGAYYRDKGARLAEGVAPTVGAHADRVERTGRKRAQSAASAAAFAAQVQAELAAALALRQATAHRVLAAVSGALAECAHAPAAQDAVRRFAQQAPNVLPADQQAVWAVAGHEHVQTQEAARAERRTFSGIDPGSSIARFGAAMRRGNAPPPVDGFKTQRERQRELQRAQRPARGMRFGQGARSFVGRRRTSEAERTSAWADSLRGHSDLGSASSSASKGGFPRSTQLGHASSPQLPSVPSAPAEPARRDEEVWDSNLHLEILETNLPPGIVLSGTFNGSSSGDRQHSRVSSAAKTTGFVQSPAYPPDETREMKKEPGRRGENGVLTWSHAPYPAIVFDKKTENKGIPPPLASVSYPSLSDVTPSPVPNRSPVPLELSVHPYPGDVHSPLHTCQSSAELGTRSLQELSAAYPPPPDPSDRPKGNR